MTHYNLVHKFIPMPQAMKIPDEKAAVDREWEKLTQENPLSWWTSVISKMRVRTKILEVRRTSRAPRCSNSRSNGRHCKTTRLWWTSSRRRISIHSRWKMLQNYSEFQSQSVQTFGYVFHDTNGQNRCQTLKTQWFLLNETYTDTNLLASCGKDNLRRFYWDLDGKKIPHWECLCIGNKDCAYRYTRMI